MDRAEDYIIIDQPAPGVQRLVAGFSGHAYDPHRHELYAVGRTLLGAQGFRYRGGEHVSLPGQCIIIHPDELHDGRADCEEGFQYQMVYVEPCLVRRVLGDKGSLPFVTDVVSRDPKLALVLADIFEAPDLAEQLEWDGYLQRLADLLHHRGGLMPSSSPTKPPVCEVVRARDYMNEEFHCTIGSTELERLTGIDRFELARAFRSHLGTSPHRYLVGRRLDAAKSRLLAGESITEVAHAVGFADQSHMARHFKSRYGVTPGRFVGLANAGRIVRLS